MSTARLAGGTGSARSSLISPLASPEAPAQLDLRSFHRSPRRRHRLGSISGHFTPPPSGGPGSARSPILSPPAPPGAARRVPPRPPPPRRAAPHAPLAAPLGGG